MATNGSSRMATEAAPTRYQAFVASPLLTVVKLSIPVVIKHNRIIGTQHYSSGIMATWCLGQIGKIRSRPTCIGLIMQDYNYNQIEELMHCKMYICIHILVCLRIVFIF